MRMDENNINAAAIDIALTTHPLGEPECNHCGGTGDVSGEYPGIACPDCAGTGKAQHKQGDIDGS
ncbi:hypothetical protein ZC03_081 [Pseudomonas phage ZC03]|uniref:Uncharacterized protein n=2 Tax=Zicotriavirus TaxID=2843161 RepID=A0A1L2C981_9CAUD|nr:hypothetical protein HWA93_gp48 [Pseudomonas phage ZC03]YP_009830640.1 hypothetical protein HWA94_gp48 [Pseudomonas phage ZC08]AMD43458.1 hypothetical protein ZC03_081 [Pseudomonas phage ZC03]AMD43487.1 hypothetical protein ZC08_078 [Pseudomonas phage ZC08]